MIRLIERNEIEKCVEVIRKSFLTVAQEYGFTQDNAPRFTAFDINSEALYKQFDEGRPMYAYFDEDEQILGYYSLNIQEDGECELNNLCVLPKYRHKKIGESLFFHGLMIAADRGCVKVNIGIVEENKKLRAWYEKLGAKHIGTKKFDFFPFTCGYMEKTVYAKELLIDLKDYANGGTVFKRTAVRGIVRKDGKYLMVYGKYGDYKFPGGGLKAGERLCDTLIREVKEETGYSVIPESIRGCILVHEKRKGDIDDLMVMDSWYFFCDVSEQKGARNLDEYEKEYDYQTWWFTLEEAIAKNQAVTGYEKIPWVAWVGREMLVMKEIDKENK